MLIQSSWFTHCCKAVSYTHLDVYKRQVITWVLYMIETNIRSSTLIGILTATGIGYLFDLYYKRLDFSSASLVVLSIVVLVLVIEGVSNKIRKVIL